MSTAPGGRTPQDEPGLALLERALDYTCSALGGVTDASLHRATPCERWDLAQLLAHMEDALDAFAEGAHGSVSLAPQVPAEVRVTRLQQQACSLLASWSAPPARVDLGTHALDGRLLVLAAALEITVHGWDVAQATGSRVAVPADLAARLLPVAVAFVGEDDRGDLFAAPVPASPGGSAEHRLLTFLGRDLTGPPGHVSLVHRTRERPAS